MSISWHFNEARPGDRARESQVEKFFNSDAVANRANAIVREGIQNSLDAAPDTALVKVRIAVGVWTDEQKQARLHVYSKGFFDHLNVESVRAKVPNAPDTGDPFRYLVFEDFGTSGLLGDPSQWWTDDHRVSNPFFNYFRAEGISDKIDGKRGRHGVGRLVFMFASRARSVFGLTRRDDGRQLLMGTSVLRNHRLHEIPYFPDGWFGVPSDVETGLILPVEDDPDFLRSFKANFGVSRGEDQSGLSVIIPWLSDEVTVAEIIRSVLTGYFLPILRQKLIVEIVDEAGKLTLIDDGTITSVIEEQNGELAANVIPLLTLAKNSLSTSERLLLAPPGGNAPKWSIPCVPEDVRAQIQGKLERGDLISLRVPMQTREKGCVPVDCHFDIFLQRDTTANEGQIIFIREGIIITDVRPRRTSGIRALVVVDEGSLATFLGDSENPSHTQWQKELVREKYSVHAATIEYVVHSVPAILNILSEQQKKPDTSLLLDLFSLPSQAAASPPTRRQRPESSGGGETEEEVVSVESKPKRFGIQKVDAGFSIRPGDPLAERPPTISIKVAYGVRRGSPFVKYNPADFRLGLGGVECKCEHGCTLIDFADNWMVVQITDDDFEIVVTGFDPNRDLHVDVKVADKEVVDAAAA